jgi:type I restriction enzyme S subunit
VSTYSTEWSDTTLGELADFEMGQAPPGSECNKEGKGTVFVKAGEFGVPYPIEVEWTTKPLKYGRKGDVFICVVGATAGKLNLGIDCAIGRSVAAIRPREGVDTKFIYYQLMPWVLKLRAASAGSAQGVISKVQLREIPFRIVSLEKQKLIVAEIEKQFSRLDEAVAGLKRVKANIKRYKAAVLKAAVEGRLVETEAELARREGRSYETGEQLLTRILETRRSQWKGKGKYKEPAAPDTTGLPELPEGWVWATVERLNLAQRPCAYGVLQPGDDQPDGTLFIRVGDINDGRVDLSSLKRIAPDIARQYPRTKLSGGEFLITLVGAIGRTAVVPDTLAGANVARAVGVAPLSQYVDAHWVEIWFRNPAKVTEMTLKSHEVARKTLNLEDVRAASVAVPPVAEQARIVAEVDSRLSVAKEIESEIDLNLMRAERMRQSILTRAFAGKLQ